MSKDIDENVKAKLDYDKLDQYGKEFAKECFIKKNHNQCIKMHEYYKYSDSELTSIYISGKIS